MRHTIRKWFWAWEFDKEEKWLTECAAKGLALVSVGFCRYDFEECTPGAYQVRLEFLDNLPSHPESQQYLRFLEETGAEHIGSFMRWVYLRRPTEYGPFDLFSDNASRVRHLGRIIALIWPLGILNTGIGAYNLGLGVMWGSSANVICGCLNLSVTVLLAIGLWKLGKKRNRLKREGQIFE